MGRTVGEMFAPFLLELGLQFVLYYIDIHSVRSVVWPDRSIARRCKLECEPNRIVTIFFFFFRFGSVSL